MADNSFRPLTEEEFEAVRSNTADLNDIIGRVSHTFQAADRKEQLRPRKGSESFQRSLFTQAKLQNLSLEGYDLDQVKNAQILVKQLQDLSSQLQILSKTVSDTLLASNGFIWDSTLNYYRVLNAIAQGNSKLAIAMKPIQEFMSKTGKKQDKDDDNDAQKDAANEEDED